MMRFTQENGLNTKKQNTMKTKMYLFLICLLTAIIGVQAHDFEALNEDGVPIYYNFSGDETSVVVTYGKKYYTWPYSGNVVIPESVMYNDQFFNVTAIGDSAFYQCFDLTGVIIPNNVTTIGNYAFELCDKLNDITISNNVITIGEYAFSTCRSLTNVSLPASVITIGDGAFNGCIKVTTVTIGENVAVIGSGAFDACISITNIIIPENVITIGIGAFINCLNLEEFIVSEQNRNYSTIDGVLFNKDQTVLIAYPNAKSPVYTIPDGVFTIGSCAFNNCDLTDISISSSVTTIEVLAFKGTKLSNIIIPNQVTTIGDYAFGACSKLKKVIIPNSDISFGDRIFSWNVALEEIHNLSPIPQSIGSSSFTYVDKSSCKLFVPKGALSDYQAADVWKEFKNIIELNGMSVISVNKENISVFPIKGGISINCDELTEVEIFSTTGQLVYQFTFRGYKKIPLGEGLYIVCINGENKKIMVK